MLLASRQSHKERFVFDRATCVGEGLYLSSVFVLFCFLVGKPFLVILFTGEDFSLAMVTNFD